MRRFSAVTASPRRPNLTSRPASPTKRFAESPRVRPWETLCSHDADQQGWLSKQRRERRVAAEHLSSSNDAFLPAACEPLRKLQCAHWIAPISLTARPAAL